MYSTGGFGGNIMLKFIFSLLVGMVPEVLYFTLFIVFTKGLKEKRIRLFLLIALSYMLCVMIIRFQIVYYISFIFITFLILKFLYNKETQLIDIFVISLASIYLTLISFICSLFINNNYLYYYLLFILNRVLLFAPFILRNKLNIFYNKYCELWNRSRNKEEKRLIKSITLRNVSLITVNSFIFLLNICTIFVINTFN